MTARVSKTSLGAKGGQRNLKDIEKRLFSALFAGTEAVVLSMKRSMGMGERGSRNSPSYSFPPDVAHRFLQRGVPSKTMAPLSELLELTQGDLADLVGIDRTTALRLAKAEKPLPTPAAEVVLRLVELEAMAEDIFESPQDASGWLRTKHPLFDGERPIDYAKTGYGFGRVKEVLTALKYGGAV